MTPSAVPFVAVDDVCEGSCFSQTTNDLPNVDKLSSFRSFCASSAFIHFATEKGLKGASFEYIVTGKRIQDQFALNLTDACSLAVVFHGTHENNIPSILLNGLDPLKRRGQAYGPGEYFSKNPSVAASYCKGGKKLLVFVVIVPPKRVHRNYVVVSRIDHQLPLGVVSFLELDVAAHHSALRTKSYLQRLSDNVITKENAAYESKVKATIIQWLIQGSVDIASEKYVKEVNILTSLSKKEVSMYVYRLVDADIVGVLFPGLPPPVSGQELDAAGIKSVSTMEQEAHEAKQQLMEEQAKAKNASMTGRMTIFSGRNT